MSQGGPSSAGKAGGGGGPMLTAKDGGMFDKFGSMLTKDNKGLLDAFDGDTKAVGSYAMQQLGAGLSSSGNLGTSLQGMMQGMDKRQQELFMKRLLDQHLASGGTSAKVGGSSPLGNPAPGPNPTLAPGVPVSIQQPGAGLFGDNPWLQF